MIIPLLIGLLALSNVVLFAAMRWMVYRFRDASRRIEALERRQGWAETGQEAMIFERLRVGAKRQCDVMYRVLGSLRIAQGKGGFADRHGTGGNAEGPGGIRQSRYNIHCQPKPFYPSGGVAYPDLNEVKRAIEKMCSGPAT